MRGTIVEVRLPVLHALRQTSTIKVVEEFKEIQSDGTNALRCVGPIDLLAVILGCVMSACARYPADVQYLPRFGLEPGPGIYLFHGRNALLRSTVFFALPALLASPAESVVTKAVPTTVETARAVVEDNYENEIGSCASSEMVHEVFEKIEEKTKKQRLRLLWHFSRSKIENRACCGKRGS